MCSKIYCKNSPEFLILQENNLQRKSAQIRAYVSIRVQMLCKKGVSAPRGKSIHSNARWICPQGCVKVNTDT